MICGLSDKVPASKEGTTMTQTARLDLSNNFRVEFYIFFLDLDLRSVRLVGQQLHWVAGNASRLDPT